MGNNKSLFSEEEISELEQIVKDKTWHRLVDFAIEKNEKNELEITKVRTTKNFIKVFDSYGNEYPFKIRMSSDKRKTEGYALAAYAMGLLGNAKENFICLKDNKEKSVSTKHPKNHSRKDIIDALDCINECITQYKLDKKMGISYVPYHCEEICLDIVDEEDKKELISYQSLPKEEKEEIKSYAKKLFQDDLSVSEVIKILKNNKGIDISRTPLDNLKGKINRILEEKKARNNELWEDSVYFNIPKDSQEYSRLFGDTNVSDYEEKIPKGSYILEEVLENTEMKEGDIITTKRLKMDYLE